MNDNDEFYNQTIENYLNGNLKDFLIMYDSIKKKALFFRHCEENYSEALVYNARQYLISKGF